MGPGPPTPHGGTGVPPQSRPCSLGHVWSPPAAADTPQPSQGSTGAPAAGLVGRCAWAYFQSQTRSLEHRRSPGPPSPSFLPSTWARGASPARGQGPDLGWALGEPSLRPPSPTALQSSLHAGPRHPTRGPPASSVTPPLGQAGHPAIAKMVTPCPQTRSRVPLARASPSPRPRVPETSHQSGGLQRTFLFPSLFSLPLGPNWGSPSWALGTQTLPLSLAAHTRQHSPTQKMHHSQRVS